MSGKSLLFAVLVLIVLAAPASALTTKFSRSPLLGKGDGQSFSFQGDFGVNPMTRSQAFSIQLLSLPGRAGMDLSLGLSFSNNFWQMVDFSYLSKDNSFDQLADNSYIKLEDSESFFELARPSFASDGGSMIPVNNLGGWSLISPAGARLYHNVNAYSVTEGGYLAPDTNIWIPARTYTNCRTQFFTYTGADGSVSFFYPSIKINDVHECTSKDIDYLNSLKKFSSTEFYSTNGNGRKMIFTGESKEIDLGWTRKTGTVVRIIDTTGSSVELLLVQQHGGFGQNDVGELKNIAYGVGIPLKVGDRFGNYISMSYNFAQDSSSAWYLDELRITDTAGRVVVLKYDPEYLFPHQIIAKDFYPDGEDMKITIDFQELYYDNKNLWNKCSSVGKFRSYTSSNYFVTVKSVTTPNNLKWSFNYDRGWGTTSPSEYPYKSVTSSDGSLAEATNPYGKKSVFTFNGLYEAPKPASAPDEADELSQFLGIDGCVKYGYVKSLENYQKDASRPEVKVVYTTSSKQSGKSETMINYYNGSGAPLKLESHVFGYKTVDFVEDSSEVMDSATGKVLLKTTKDHKCATITTTPVFGKAEGFCRTVSSTAWQEGAEKTEAVAYDSIDRTIYTPTLEGAAGVLFEKKSPFYRPVESSLYDENGLVKTDKTLYADDVAYLNANLIGLVKTQKTFDRDGNLFAWSEIKYDTQPVVGVDRGKITNFAPVSTPIGLPTEQINYDPTGKLQPIIAKTIYNEAGQAVKTINPRGYATTTEYDPDKGCGGTYTTKATNALRQSSSISYDCRSGIATAATDLNGLSTRAEYSEPLLRITKITNPDGTFATAIYDDSARTTTEHYFSSKGQMIKKTTSFYDGDGRLVKLLTTNPNGQGEEEVTISYEFDALGRRHKAVNEYGYQILTEFDSLDRPVKTTSPNGAEIQYNYDGRKTTITDPYGREKTVEVDSLGRLISVRDERESLTRYEYDVLGNLIRVLHPDNAERLFTYDGFGRPKISKIPEMDGVYTAEEYDANGNPTTIRTADDYVIRTTYDALDRPLAKTYSGSVPTNTAAYEYDKGFKAAGQITKVKEGRISRSFEYDSAGRVKTESMSIDSNTFPITYSYNDFGSLESVGLPSGRVLKYSYNNAGQLRLLTGIFGGRISNLLALNKFAKHGPAIMRTFGNGLIEQTNFDQRTLLVTSRNTGQILRLDYNYKTAPEKCDGSGYYSAAEVNDIGTINEKILSQERRLLFGYDCLDRLKTAQSAGFRDWKLDYAFDSSNNRIRQEGVPTLEESLSFDGKNHDSGMSYDRAGNVINDGENRYAYDGAGRLVKVTTPDGEVEYFYLGTQRIIKKAGNDETYYIRGANGVLYSEFENKPDNAGKDATKFYHKDHVGSVRAITDSGGNVLSSHSFYPYGEEETQDSDSTNRKFTGHERDKETGNDYMKTRFYEPERGTFLSADSGTPDMTRPQNWNRYAYASNNPVKFVDPDGLQAKKVDVLIFYVPGEIDTDYKSGNMFENTAGERAKLYRNKGLNVKLLAVKDVWSDYNTIASTLMEVGKQNSPLKFIEFIGHSGSRDIAGLEGESVKDLKAAIGELNVIGKNTRATMIGCHTAGWCSHDTGPSHNQALQFARLGRQNPAAQRRELSSRLGQEISPDFVQQVLADAEGEGRRAASGIDSIAQVFSEAFGISASGSTTGMSVTQGGNVLGLGPGGGLHREMHWRTFYSGKEGPPLSDIYLTKPWDKK